MRIRVIRTDGTPDKVRSSSFGMALKSGEIAAFHCSEGWVEVRRIGNIGVYNGVERRKRIPFGLRKTLKPAKR